MSKLVRAGMLALTIVHNSGNVFGVTLRTLMESQLTADSAIQAEVSLQLEEDAVRNLARDFYELSLAQLQDEADGTEATSDNLPAVDPEMVALAEQLVELSKNGLLGDLRACILDVKSGAYQTSMAAKLAAGTLQPELDDEGNQYGTILVNASGGLYTEGDTLSTIDGQTLINVEPAVVETETAVVETVTETEDGATATEDDATSGEDNLVPVEEGAEGVDVEGSETAGDEENQDGDDQAPNPDNSEEDAEAGNEEEETSDAATDAAAQQDPPPPDDDDGFFSNWLG